MSEEKKSHWYLWPFEALWRLVTWVFELTGRVVAIILGLVLIVIGTLLSLTVVGAVIGVPVGVFGILLLLRGLF
jgi:uncharacterized membrane protein YdbT with pleckstrin-like domain